MSIRDRVQLGTSDEGWSINIESILYSLVDLFKREDP